CCIVWIYGLLFFFFSSRRRHTRSKRDWSSDVCSSDLPLPEDLTFPYVRFCADVIYHAVLLQHHVRYILFLYKQSEYHPFIILAQIGRASCRERECCSCCADALRRTSINTKMCVHHSRD